jgi:hypothetical protein
MFGSALWLPLACATPAFATMTRRRGGQTRLLTAKSLWNAGAAATKMLRGRVWENPSKKTSQVAENQRFRKFPLAFSAHLWYNFVMKEGRILAANCGKNLWGHNQLQIAENGKLTQCHFLYHPITKPTPFSVGQN